MHCLVTGAAGFIGSQLCRRLLRDGHRVVGVDAFVPYYPRALKEANLADLRGQPAFTFCEADLRQADLAPLLHNVEVVYHLAAMPGLARSWTDFDLYLSCNVTATQRLLDACRGLPLHRFILASTSSVYGRQSVGGEDLPTVPISPYGVTKLAAEHLCRAHAEECGLPLVCLRYFSVYGPGQRPDMGYHRFIRGLLLDQPLIVYGDGTQVRGNTYIDDCVAASVLALAGTVRETYQVGGGEAVSVLGLIAKLEILVGRQARLVRRPGRPGDQQITLADTTKLRRQFGWAPRTSLDEGLERQLAWQQALHFAEDDSGTPASGVLDAVAGEPERC